MLTISQNMFTWIFALLADDTDVQRHVQYDHPHWRPASVPQCGKRHVIPVCGGQRHAETLSGHLH